jgi:hypothetical protein
VIALELGALLLLSAAIVIHTVMLLTGHRDEIHTDTIAMFVLWVLLFRALLTDLKKEKK